MWQDADLDPWLNVCWWTCSWSIGKFYNDRISLHVCILRDGGFAWRHARSHKVPQVVSNHLKLKHITLSLEDVLNIFDHQKTMERGFGTWC